MKITIDPNSIPFISEEQSCGGKTFASFSRIVDSMIVSGEITLKLGETISEVTMNEYGLAFKIKDAV